MRRILSLLILIITLLISHAQERSWICAIEWTENQPEWVFVYEDVKLNSDGTYRAFVKWEFEDDPKRACAKQTWLISPDFDQIRVLGTVGYDKHNNVVYNESTPQDWRFVLPETYAEGIVKTVREILLKQ